ncbi:MAG TPA: hypothetical protein VGP72_31995 [Planctomycetota bacterium]|jgi:hypothetical protein
MVKQAWSKFRTLITELGVPILTALLIGLGGFVWSAHSTLSEHAAKIDSAEKRQADDRKYMVTADEANSKRFEDCCGQLSKRLDGIHSDLTDIKADIRQLRQNSLTQSH